ncbi:hypothetical protein ACWKSR_12050, partial [Campylobacter fetus subsp. venerealis]
RISDIQASLNIIPDNTSALHLYLANSQKGLKSAFYLSPLKPILFLGSADLAASQKQVVSVEGEKALEVDPNGLMIPSSEGNEPTVS